MQGIMNSLAGSGGYKAALAAAEAGVSALVYGAGDGVQTHLSCALALELGRPLVIVTANELKARAVLEDVKLYFREEGRHDPLFFPAKDPLFYQADVRGLAIEEGRMKVFRLLQEEKKPVIVMSVEAFYDRLMPREEWKKFILHHRIGERMPLPEACDRLVRMGYERRDQVDSPGQFSVRGGILDVFPITEEAARRIEMWDDEIDTIRVMDTETQRSLNRVEDFTIYPAAEIMVDEARMKLGLSRIQSGMHRGMAGLKKAGLEEEAERLRELSERTVERLENGSFRGLESYTSVFFDSPAVFSDYLPADTLICFQDPGHIREKTEVLERELSDSLTHRIEKGYLLPEQAEMYPEWPYIEHALSSFGKMYFCSLLAGNENAYPVRELIGMKTHSVSGLQTAENALLDELKANVKMAYRTVLFCESSLQVARLVSQLKDEDLSAYAYENLKDQPAAGAVAVAQGRLSQGFTYTDAKLSFIPLKENSASRRNGQRRKRFSGTRLDSFADLKVGDYIVHENHGVGIYHGIVQMGEDDRRRDYFKIVYKDGGALYVPTTSLDLLQKYSAGEDAEPKLNKLGGSEWQKTKLKVREGVARLAEDLVALYAARRARKGFAFSPDTVWQKEFEELFPYDETADQLQAIEETKRDMESETIMDRLICGDVGYGKTEIAIRAAFKAVQDGKQVAMLAPTTILAQQHYNTFTGRMRDFPVRIELLSRFRSPKEVEKAIADTRKGAVDILIGTHRLLSDDVRFRDLGLLIVDEEQRFGVGHKEKMKAMKKDVDVLTLTATPIPRTLHMSLTGIRDMSLLQEAPQDRQPIQTYVMEEEPTLVREAIYRELSRGGQVFFLHNRVQNIDEVAASVQKLVPEARVAFAHGQMSERELENVMMNFVQGEVDVLVCTTIIETGLDISNVNTIIIENADAMGLAQLYQLRGRVGRSSRLAYAYFLYRKGKVLPEAAAKRLEAIGEFTEFGSGYKIAMRDLEIRGAGNILGAEQHGHMGAVGYDLYCKMLEDAMSSLTDGPVQEDFETEVHVRVNAFIPPEYIPNEGQKLQIYRKIAAIRTEEDFFEMQDELLDRFSDMPLCVSNLLDVSYIKSLGQMIGVELIDYAKGLLSLSFRKGASPDPGALSDYLARTAGRSRLVTGAGATKIVIAVRHDERDEVLLDRIKKEMKDISSIGGKEKNA